MMNEFVSGFPLPIDVIGRAAVYGVRFVPFWAFLDINQIGDLETIPDYEMTDCRALSLSLKRDNSSIIVPLYYY